MRLSAALAVPFLLLFAWDASTPIAQAAGLPAPVTAPAPLAAHHALYALTLDNGREGDIVAATGTMGYEVIDACDGWAVRQRLDMTVTNSDGQDIHMISDYATWESKDGLKLRFHMKQTTDSAVTSDGQRIANPRHLERKARSLARYQRRMTRCQRGSANRA